MLVVVRYILSRMPSPFETSSTIPATLFKLSIEIELNVVPITQLVWSKWLWCKEALEYDARLKNRNDEILRKSNREGIGADWHHSHVIGATSGLHVHWTRNPRQLCFNQAVCRNRCFQASRATYRVDPSNSSKSIVLYARISRKAANSVFLAVLLPPIRRAFGNSLGWSSSKNSRRSWLWNLRHADCGYRSGLGTQKHIHSY